MWYRWLTLPSTISLFVLMGETGAPENPHRPVAILIVLSQRWFDLKKIFSCWLLLFIRTSSYPSPSTGWPQDIFYNDIKMHWKTLWISNVRKRSTFPFKFASNCTCAQIWQSKQDVKHVWWVHRILHANLICVYTVKLSLANLKGKFDLANAYLLITQIVISFMFIVIELLP